MFGWGKIGEKFLIWVNTLTERFVKTPDEKKQHIDNEERERLLENDEKTREYLKDQLRDRD